MSDPFRITPDELRASLAAMDRAVTAAFVEATATVARVAAGVRSYVDALNQVSRDARKDPEPTPTDCRTRRRCPIPDDPCGPGGARPYCWEKGR